MHKMTDNSPQENQLSTQVCCKSQQLSVLCGSSQNPHGSRLKQAHMSKRHAYPQIKRNCQQI